MEILWVLLLLSSVVKAKETHYVHWNSSNPMFRIDNTDNVIDVNTKQSNPFDYDQANIVCPFYRSSGGHKEEEEEETYIIYNVSKEEFDSCRILNPNPQVIAVCDNPKDLKYFTITFRSFTPTPGGLEFKPGQDYYFISTSTRGDLHRRVGGKCTTHNMKVIFKISDGRSPKVSKISTTTSTTSSPSRVNYKFLSEIIREESKRRKINQPKRKSRYNENAVYKQEASRMAADNSSGASSSIHWRIIALSSLLAFLIY